jgi:hypothetical protein
LLYERYHELVWVAQWFYWVGETTRTGKSEMGQSEHTQDGSRWLGLGAILLAAFVLISVQSARADSTPSYCAQSTITGASFLQALHTVITHGDLTDKEFIENTLDTRLTQSAQWNNQSTGQVGAIYETGEVLGNPIYMRLVENLGGTQSLDDSVGAVVVGGGGSTFMHDCFKLSLSDISSVFPGRYFNTTSPLGDTAKELSVPGPHRSTFYLNIGLEKDKLVDSIIINQSAFLPLTPVRPSPAYCATARLTGPEYMQAIDSIVTHGDLTDIPYLKKILRTTFKSSFGFKADGTPDRQTVNYEATTVLGAPIHVHIVDWSKDMQIRMRQIARISFDGQVSPTSSTDYIGDCLNIHVSDFYSAYGNQFTFMGPVGMIPVPGPGVNVEKGALGNQNFPGKNGSTISLGFSVQSPWDHSVTEDTQVSGVWMIQRP